ncbi:MAG TPA: hypothetical protein PKW56_02420 [Clostridiales bacterium]|nr:hypothetical protein [Clostridiales bacterium]
MIKKLPKNYSEIRTAYHEMTLSRSKSIKASVAALILIGLLDYFTGPQFGFFVFYYIPILFAGWFLDRRTAIIYAFIATIIWWTADSIGDNLYNSEFFRYWNSFIRLLSFLLVGVLFSNFRIRLDKEQKLNSDLSKALSEVKQLRGLLPICASCKSIRNDKGAWEQMEDYVKEHSDAVFSHSLCPSCMEKLYPAVAKRRKEKLEAAEKNEAK